MESDKTNIDVDKLVNHFRESSDEDFQTMLNLLNMKSYNWSLFIGHISLEKLLKALYIKVNKEHAPYTHNLLRLAEKSSIKIPDDYSDWLDEITSFNINARYNDFKKEFYNKCTREFVTEWIEKIKLLREWIIKKL